MLGALGIKVSVSKVIGKSYFIGVHSVIRYYLFELVV